MSLIKTHDEINKIREGGKILHRILREVGKMAKPGISTWELDEYAEKQIIAAGGKPAFKNYGPKDNPFPATLCTSINDVVVHGVPSEDLILEEGDILGLDIGMQYLGLYTDTAITVGIGKISKEAQLLLETTEKALEIGIKKAIAGNRIGDIGSAVQKVADAKGYGVIRDLVGHGVGHDVHEEPQVPNYGKAGTGPELKVGMVIAIEPMFTLGTYKLAVDADGWSLATADGSLAAHFEHTVAITKNGPQILT